MAKKKQKKKKKMPEQIQRPKDFLDMIAPAAVKFNTDHFILGSRYHTAMALKSYPPMTDELALLRGLGDMGGVNLRLTARQVTPAEEDVILHAATNKSRMERSNTNDYKQSVTAEANLRDMAELLAKQRQEKEPLIHCGVYLDIAAADTEKLRAARDTVSAQLVRSRMGADPLLLRQREGFLSANPAGGSQLANFAERVLPARSVANLYPMNYSGKTDPKGFFIGRDRFGSNIIVDFDRRASDKTNASALILGNTGQGKSYLLKLLLCNVREAGKSVISLDSEHEMEDECRALGGCFLDYLSGQYRINLLEPRCWDDGSGPEDPDAPDAFRGTLLSQGQAKHRYAAHLKGQACPAGTACQPHAEAEHQRQPQQKQYGQEYPTPRHPVTPFLKSGLSVFPAKGQRSLRGPLSVFSGRAPSILFFCLFFPARGLFQGCSGCSSS